MLTTRVRFVVILLASLLTVAGCGHAGPPVKEVGQVFAALGVRAGMNVADVGAGDGEWSEALAGKIGDSGTVYATEVDEDDIEELREHFADLGLDNVQVVLGDDTATGLPDDCCDAILLRLVYHHFTEPQRMRDELRRALKPGGRLVIVEIEVQKNWADLPGVPDRGGHGIYPDDLLREMESDGWNALEHHDDWGQEEDHYCTIFN